MLFGDKAVGARKKIQGVFDGFQKMVDDLTSGVSALKEKRDENDVKISELTVENFNIGLEISGAVSLKRKLEDLMKGV